jgi:hypothetical protein
MNGSGVNIFFCDSSLLNIFSFFSPRLGDNRNLFIPLVTYPHLKRFLIKNLSPLPENLALRKKKMRRERINLSKEYSLPALFINMEERVNVLFWYRQPQNVLEINSEINYVSKTDRQANTDTTDVTQFSTLFIVVDSVSVFRWD